VLYPLSYEGERARDVFKWYLTAFWVSGSPLPSPIAEIGQADGKVGNVRPCKAAETPECERRHLWKWQQRHGGKPPY
jgi:hypothetical protein